MAEGGLRALSRDLLGAIFDFLQAALDLKNRSRPHALSTYTQ